MRVEATLFSSPELRWIFPFLVSILITRVSLGGSSHIKEETAKDGSTGR